MRRTFGSPRHRPGISTHRALYIFLAFIQVVSERPLQLRAPERLKASVPHFRYLSEGVPEGKEIVMHGGGGLAPRRGLRERGPHPPAAEPLIPVRRKRKRPALSAQTWMVGSEDEERSLRRDERRAGRGLHPGKDGGNDGIIGGRVLKGG